MLSEPAPDGEFTALTPEQLEVLHETCVLFSVFHAHEINTERFPEIEVGYKKEHREIKKRFILFTDIICKYIKCPDFRRCESAHEVLCPAEQLWRCIPGRL